MAQSMWDNMETLKRIAEKLSGVSLAVKDFGRGSYGFYADGDQTDSLTKLQLWLADDGVAELQYTEAHNCTELFFKITQEALEMSRL